MSDTSAFGFGKFIPGFDFLQNLAQAGQSASAMPQFSHWIAPTVSVEEIDKRIEELKAVQFWLEQNSRALSATVQALQVQRMTLSTLKGMNVNLADLAQAFPFVGASQAGGRGSAASVAGSPLADWPLSGVHAARSASAPQTSEAAEPAPMQATASTFGETQAAGTGDAPPEGADTTPGMSSAGIAAAMQWWGALTQQFQQIAQQALQDPAQQQVMAKATQMTTEFAKTAVQTAGEMVRQAVAQSTQPPAQPKRSRSTSTAAKGKAASAPAQAPRHAASAKPSGQAPAARKRRTQRAEAAAKATTTDKKGQPSAAIPKVSVTKKKTTVRKPAAR